MTRNLIFISAIALLSACIGTDEVDDPIVGASIELAPVFLDPSGQEQYQLSLLTGGSGTVSATYYNQYGIQEDVQILWEAEDPSVASTDIDGTINGLAPGQTNVLGNVAATESSPFLITVVETETEVSGIAISSSAGEFINVNQSRALNISITNLLGDSFDSVPVEWTSSDESILEVNTDGEITGVADGFAEVVATAEGLQSNRLGFMVGRTSRTGTFVGASGYDSAGSTELYLRENGDLILDLKSDFETNFALGTFIYLANSTNGIEVSTSGLEVAEISSSGAASFNISDIDDAVSINDYDYVIVLCKPARLTFGIAQLN